MRKLSTDGLAVITSYDGVAHEYPISKLKYKVSDTVGISLNMELGTPEQLLTEDLFNIERLARDAELLQQASTKQTAT